MKSTYRTARKRLAVALAYAALVLIADTLIIHGAQTPFNWNVLRWTAGPADLFKFTAWFAIPLLIASSQFDVHYFTLRRWKPIDWLLLAAIAGAGALLMLILPALPGVGEYYRGWGSLPLDTRWNHAYNQLIWTLSWITGWEFIHRYWLPKSFLDAWPRRGWIPAITVIPLFETLYHIIQQKPILECLGVAALSLVLCAWTLRRRNALLPFLAHLIIEVELIVFLFFKT